MYAILTLLIIDFRFAREVKVEISKDSDMLLRSARGQYELYLESYDENGYSDASPDFTLGPSETSGVSGRKVSSNCCSDDINPP